MTGKAASRPGAELSPRVSSPEVLIQGQCVGFRVGKLVLVAVSPGDQGEDQLVAWAESHGPAEVTDLVLTEQGLDIILLSLTQHDTPKNQP
jgi:hypothetical protein